MTFALLACFATMATEELTIPIHAAYLVGEAGRARIDEESGLTRWTDARTRVMWGGRLAHDGKLEVTVEFNDRVLAGAYRLAVNGDSQAAASNGNRLVSSFDVKPGWVRIELVCDANRAEDAPTPVALRLSGPAAAGAQFNLKPRRNAASVHLSYVVPTDLEIEWFYNEVTAVEDPIHTFYMACGFSRGYFGIQVNSPTERRVIFSVWDSGTEAVDRNRVAADDLVQLLAKGEDVYASGFGNEGTGGHSHLKTLWQTGAKQRLLVHAKPDGTATVYTGYWMPEGATEWKLISRFRAPKDGGYLRRPHTFVENFWGDNGHLLRKARFGPAWARTASGEWRFLDEVRFSHDVTGGADRYDYDFGRDGDLGFFLQNGGFIGASPTRGATLRARGTAPKDPGIILPHELAPPTG